MKLLMGRIESFYGDPSPKSLPVREFRLRYTDETASAPVANGTPVTLRVLLASTL